MGAETLNVPLSINVQTTFLVLKFPHKKEGFVWSSRLRTARKAWKNLEENSPSLVDQGGNTPLSEASVQRRHSCFPEKRLAGGKGRNWTELCVVSEQEKGRECVFMCVGRELLVVGVQSLHVNYRCQSWKSACWPVHFPFFWLLKIWKVESSTHCSKGSNAVYLL